MTCTTTHHACDCVLERMKKLEAVAEAVKNLGLDTMDWLYEDGYEQFKAVKEAVEELERE